MPAKRSAPSSLQRIASSVSADPPRNGRCSKCSGLMEIEQVEEQRTKSQLIWYCINCGRRCYQEIKKLHLSPPGLRKQARPSSHGILLPAVQDESSEGFPTVCHHFHQKAAEINRRLLSCTVTPERGAFTMQVLCLSALVTVAEALRVRWIHTTRWCDFVIQQATHRVPQNPDPCFARLLDTYSMLMLRAEKHGLGGDPIVNQWLRGHRDLGQKDYLRRARRGLEKGVKRPYRTPKELERDLEIMRLHLENKTLRQIEYILNDKNLHPPEKTLSHVAISDRINALQKELPWFRIASELR
jgi:hypothetical protein